MWSSSLGLAANDWDLGAVVRSCRPSGAARCNSSCFPPPTLPVESGEQEVAAAEGGKGGSFVGFPDLLRTRNGVQELEELCRPFFLPKVQQQLPPPLPRACSSSPSPADAAAAVPHQSTSSRQAHRPLSQIPRSKTRKNQQKKVVCQVPADGLSSDVWAWRKYGQKPIKGSPYPRGYYRCSSSKGCLARKQVERSRTDPTVFIITYTAEHNHPVPTHRNSLAGSTRHKFPCAAPASAAAGAVDEGGGPLPPGNPSVSPPSSSTATGLSPTTPLTASMEDELLLRRRRSQAGEDGDEEEDDDDEEEEDDGMLLVEDMEVMGEDDLLFMSSGADGAAGAPSSSGEAEAAAAFIDGDGGVGDHCFPPAWSRQSKNAAAAAGGR